MSKVIKTQAETPSEEAGRLWKAVLRETLRQGDFDPARLAASLARNEAPAYGFTLIIGRPLPENVLARIAGLRRTCEKVLDGQVRLHPEETLHLTVYSLLRSRSEPIPSHILLPLWHRWEEALGRSLQAVAPFTITLSSLTVTAEGAILLCGRGGPELHLLRQVAGALPAVSPPRPFPPYITLGQIAAPCGPAFHEKMASLIAFGTYRATSEINLSVKALKMVYYHDRLLLDTEREREFVLSEAGQRF